MATNGTNGHTNGTTNGATNYNVTRPGRLAGKVACKSFYHLNICVSAGHPPHISPRQGLTLNNPSTTH